MRRPRTLGEAAAATLRAGRSVAFVRGSALLGGRATRDVELCEQPERERSAYWQILHGAAAYTADDPWSSP